MTERIGQTIKTPLGDYLPGVKNNGNTNFVWPYIGYTTKLLGDSIPHLLMGPRTQRPTTGYGLTKGRVGQYSKSYADDMYDRIFVIPLYINVGNLTSQQKYEILFFNAYRETQSITSVTPAGVLDGIIFREIPTPQAMRALTEYTTDITFLLEGPSAINANYTFAFTAGPEQTLIVEGSRIMTFTFEPDWQSDVEEKLTYWTQIIEAYSGKEQRISLRKYPRWSLSFNVINDGRAVNVLDSLMVGWSGRLFCLPNWTEKAKLTQKAYATQDTVFAEMGNTILKTGDLAVLWTTPYDAETFEVRSVTATTVSFSTPLVRNHDLGTFVMPAKLGRVRTPLAADYLTASIVEMGVTLEPKEAEYELVPTPYPTTYEGYQVVPFRHDFAEPLEHEYSRRFEEYDNGLGQYDYKDRHGKLHEKFFKSRILLYGREEIRQFKNWLSSVQGRSNPFYVYAEEDQLQASRNITGGQNLLYIINYEYGLLAALNKLRNLLVIKTKRGDQWITRVTSYAPMDTGEVLLYLDMTFPAGFTPADLESISFLRLVRLDDDEITIVHRVDGVAEVDLVFRGVLL